MPPLERRRGRRSAVVAWVLVGLSVAIVLGVLIGGARAVHGASGPYRRAADRSFSTEAAVLVDQSNQQAAALDGVVNRMTSLDRRGLQLSLDQLAAASGATAAGAARLAAGSVPAGVAAPFATVMGDRADAAAGLRRAVDGLLSMSPAPVVGAPSAPATAASPLTAAQAEDQIGAAGALLLRADATYGALRRQLWLAPGSGRLPRSVWVHDPNLWSAAAVATLVDEVATSSGLAVSHQLSLAGVRIDPAEVPPATGAPAVPAGLPSLSLLPPTTELAVTAVVSNAGNVVETQVVVSATVQPVGAPPGTPGSSAQVKVTLAPGTSQAVELSPLRVHPGTDYLLNVAVAAPPAQTDRTGLSAAYGIRISPG